MRAFLLLICLLFVGCSGRPDVVVGSKKDTEGVILGEIASLLIEESGKRVEHDRQLGGTQILWQALKKGSIDIYPEYTGTLIKDLLHDPPNLEEALAKEGLRMSKPLGFNNTYGLGMREDVAASRGITAISQLRDPQHRDLTYGFSEEFRNRADGWNALKRHYRLNVPDKNVTVLDHETSFRGLERGTFDVIDVYTTEGAIQRFNVRVLRDDTKYFTQYDAVWVYRADLAERAPDALRALLSMEGRINAEEMSSLNGQALDDPYQERRIASRFLHQKYGRVFPGDDETNWLKQLAKWTMEHLLLVGVSLSLAIVVAVPLGVLAAKRPLSGQGVLAFAAIVQTIPSLALMVFLVPILDLRHRPAITALFLYSLLPIVRNTYAGLRDIPATLRESAAALGLPPRAIFWRIELPLASRSIFTGIKTAAVINVGTATLGALVGAGGYGVPIVTGLRTYDLVLILMGTIPAAVMTLLMQWLFDLLERIVTPRGLRLKSA